MNRSPTQGYNLLNTMKGQHHGTKFCKDCFSGIECLWFVSGHSSGLGRPIGLRLHRQ